MKTVLVVGGTGVQGRAVVSQLSKDGHKIIILARSRNSDPAKEAAAIPNVTIVESRPTWQDEAPFIEAARKADVVYVNTDGASSGPIVETYWGIRLYELARYAKVKQFIYSGLDYAAKFGDFDPKFNAGHYSGKGRVLDFLKSQPTQPMNWTATISGPYIEMLWDLLRPKLADDNETYQFRMPLEDGQLPLVHLSDFARLVSWIVEHPDESSGQFLDFATAHGSGTEIAAAFTSASGKPAEYVNIPIDEWNSVAWASMPNGPDTKFGANGVNDMNVLPQTTGEDFGAWWEFYRHNKGPERSIPRDFDRLDRILPDRVRTVEEWMRKVGYTGDFKPQLNSVRTRLQKSA